MPLLADYPLMDVIWSMIVFFSFVIWIMLLFNVLADNFRRRDHSGWAKAGWTLFVIALPLLGVLVYMIARPPVSDAELAAASPYGAYPSGAGADGTSVAREIEKAQQLRAAGAITDDEFARLKAKALA
jgi:hypothetical protein